MRSRYQIAGVLESSYSARLRLVGGTYGDF